MFPSPVSGIFGNSPWGERAARPMYDSMLPLPECHKNVISSADLSETARPGWEAGPSGVRTAGRSFRPAPFYVFPVTTGLEPVEIDAAREARAVEHHFVHPCLFPAVEQCRHLAPQEVEHDQTHGPGDRKFHRDGCRRVERVGIVLLQHTSGRQISRKPRPPHRPVPRVVVSRHRHCPPQA